MATALQELTARLDDIQANADFVASATALRPRLGEVVRWEVAGDIATLARGFISAKISRPEGLYGALLVRLLAAFERYVRQLVDSAVEQTTANAKTYDDLAKGISDRNTLLTGRALASIDAPRDHVVLDYQRLAENLASCKPGSTSFSLNAAAFSAVVTGAGPAVLERALANVDIDGWWDAIGRSPSLQSLLGTKGARATGERAKERLKRLSRWRNLVAHAGDEDVAISEVAFREALVFFRSFAEALDREVRQRLKKKGGA